ncbi:MAG TPA: MarR family transcriptional regulator [Candidatus Ligilactobacillus excrementigallinarum]|uniref:MarR family transcriptional regulator n=1 Tax=Candidatus Ligilactobacillus excrementigallinarum TaxID=2838641 RepID=A0A9D1UVN5_9LACO|nr:MarR family transcriptional regulator [Candidatus Ligilactobacillus excrementigallinarum]
MNERQQHICDMLKRICAEADQFESYWLKQSKYADLNLKEVRMLEIVSGFPEISISQLARKSNLTPGTITTAIDQLEDKDYVERNRDKHDRRMIRLSLTPKGKSLVKAWNKIYQVLSQKLLTDLNLADTSIVEKAIGNIETFLIAHS